LWVERQDGAEEVTLPAGDQFANIVAAFAAAVLSGDGDVARDLAAQNADSLRQAELVDAIREGSEYAYTS
jgi:NDP-hexose-3-ketoreductase